MKHILYIFILFFSFNVFGQGEANIWYFGESAGLDFNDCTPSAIVDGELNTVEGCSSFSDANGNLLFYSDGTTVWNRNHDIMPNGNSLLGNPSSSQSAMIIPKPGSVSIYYIFTVGALAGGDSGFNYYTIDMLEDGGFGDVIDGPIDLSEGRGLDWTEKVAAVKGADSGSFWVLSYVPNQFYAYKVTKDGVAETPIKTPAYAADDRRGYLKISPDGTKVAIAHQSDGVFLVYDFDDATGRVFNELNLPLTTEGNKPYGVEFSSNSEKLYVVASNDSFNSLIDGPPEEELTHVSTLFQFDVSLSSDAAIINSREIIHESNLFRGALQLGPDKRIYRTLSYSYSEGIPLLGVIRNPNSDGASCDYQHASVGLLGRLSTQGLPPFIASIFSQIQIIGETGDGTRTVLNSQTIGVCEGDSLDVFSEGLNGVSRYKWYYNGSSTPFSTDEILQFDNITTAENGSYKLEVFNTDLCGNVSTLEGEFIIDVQDFPIVQSLVELTNCDADGVEDGFTDFNLNDADAEITFGDTDLVVRYYLSFTDADEDVNEITSSPFNNLIASTVYARVENAIGCYSVSTVNLQATFTAFPDAYLGEEITTCDNDSINDGLSVFELSTASANILAQFSETDLSVHYYRSLSDAQLAENEIISQTDYMSETSLSQTIYVRVESDVDGGCFGIGPYLSLIVNPRPEFELDPTAFICLNLTPQITLETYNSQGNYAYEWKNESGLVISNESTATVSSKGQYSVIATSDLGCESLPQYVDVSESDVATISLDDVTITEDSENNTITIDANNLGVGDYEFALDDEFGFYQDEPYFDMVAPGIHIIFVRDENGCGVVQLEVSVIGFPKFFTPNNDGHNDNWQIKGVSENFYPTSLIYIYDRFGKIITKVDPTSDGWNGYYNGIKALATDYWYTVELIDSDGNIKERKGHFSLVRR